MRVNKTQVAVITETWLNDNIPSSALSISGFDMYRKDRNDRQGGGVAIYVSSDFKATPIESHLVPNHLELLWLKLVLSKTRILFLCAVYYPPQSPLKDEIIDSLQFMVDHLKSQHPDAKFMILGDFNDLNTAPLLDELGFQQIVSKPTRGHNILDKVFTDSSDLYKEPVVNSPISTSDHRTIIIDPINVILNSAPRKTTIRPMRDSNIRTFGQWLTSENWTCLNECRDAVEMVESFASSLRARYLQIFPPTCIKRRSDDKPWITNRVLTIISQRQKAYLLGNIPLYKTLRDTVRREIAKCKQNFYSRKVKNLKKQQPGKWHQEIRHLAGLKKTRPTLPESDLAPADQAENINNHFASICSALPPLDRNALPAFLPAPRPPPVIEAHQVYQKLRNINPSKASYKDDLPARLIREFAPELADPLARIFNECLQSGVFPDQWKLSNIVPIPKVKPCQSFDQLRPISLTPIFAKIFETFLSSWITRDISHKLDSQQYGNIRNSSTTHYLVSLVDTILKGTDKPGHVASLCAIDYAKAFDHIDHNVVVRKLIQLGVDLSLIPVICAPWPSERTRRCVAGQSIVVFSERSGAPSPV
eukprot:XP_011660846.1 PREDICTED: uncharacterized protein LOC105436707 [Strongylocentrotus purpuratus]